MVGIEVRITTCTVGEGAGVAAPGLEFFAFPTLEQLSAATVSHLREQGFGYRCAAAGHHKDHYHASAQAHTGHKRTSLLQALATRAGMLVALCPHHADALLCGPTV